MVEHKLKTWPNYWDAVACGDKTFEVRRDDRGFQKGDVLVLQKYTIGDGYITCSGERFKIQELRKIITYVLTGGQLGIEPGYVVIGLGAAKR